MRTDVGPIQEGVMSHRALIPATLRIAALLALTALSACAAMLPPSPTPLPTDLPEATATDLPTAAASRTRPPQTATIVPSDTPTRTPTRFATSRVPSATVQITRTQGPTRIPLPTSNVGRPLDLCQLVSAQEVAALAGEAVASATRTQGGCLYTFAQSGPQDERAISAGAVQGDEADDMLISLVRLFGMLASREDAEEIAGGLEDKAPTMTLLELAEATSDALTSLGYEVEDLPNTGEWAIWFMYPDPPLGVLIAIQGETLVLVAETGMEEATARDALAELAELLFERLPPEL